MKKIYTLTFAWLLALGSHAQSEPTAVPLTAENFIITSTENREAALGPVSLLELGTEATLLDIPETVEIEGETYAVTAVLGPVTGGVTVAEGRKIKVDSIGVSKTVRSIGERAFNIERSLKTMSLGFADGSELTAIADSAFYGCNMKAVNLPEGLKSIGKAAFVWARYNYDEEKVAEAMAIYDAACEKYPSVMFDNEDPGYTFTFREAQGQPRGYYIDGITGAKKQNLVLPELLTGKASGNGWNQNNYTAPVVGISAGAFAFCKDLQSITVPSRLQLIEEGAFFGCTALAEVNGLDAAQLDTVYSDSRGVVTTGIRPFAFADCTALTSLSARVNLGTSLMVVGCDNMKELSLETKDNLYEVDGIYYSVDRRYVGTNSIYDNVLNYYPAGREETELTLADSIYGIGFCALAGSRLERVILPSSVQEITSAAFWRNHSLKELVLTTNDPDSIPSFITTEGTTTLSQGYTNYQLNTTVPGYGTPYKYTGLRSQYSGLAYIEQQTGYPSFDADYTRENTVVKMSAEALQKLEEYEQNGWPVHTDRPGGPYTNRNRYEALLATFMAIEKGITTGISGQVATHTAPAKTVYSLSGQRLSHPRRGLNIIDGRKVVVR